MLLSNGSPMRSRLIGSGYTPDQLNLIDAYLDSTYFAMDENGELLYDSADGLRIARADNASEVERYERVKRAATKTMSDICDVHAPESCVEHVDVRRPTDDGDVMIGFSYRN